MLFQRLKAGREICLPKRGSWPKTVHVFDEDSLWALRAAASARRPLLIKGEPGCGKSQLARAAAEASGRLFIAEVVHGRSEGRDLQWRFDAVARLGEAQARGNAQQKPREREAEPGDVTEGKPGEGDSINPLNFLIPGVLWWAFDWGSANRQADRCRVGCNPPVPPTGWDESLGCVLLIDEIDKAEADLPNGLLETLGNGAFPVPHMQETVGLAENSPPPLVIITTNRERELPAPFLRRCLVLKMNLPEDKTELLAWFTSRGAAHFKDCHEDVLAEAARLIVEDRREVEATGVYAAGQAEYLDLLRAVTDLGKGKKTQLQLLEKIAKFSLSKAD